jgi:hypothetical protein
MMEILKVAQKELDDAFEYYESQMSGLGDEFFEEFEAAIQRIEEFPEAWHPFSPTIRRCQFNRFPYGVVYHIGKTGILVLAVAHLHRRPNYWRGRITG